jgi:hypothetical protein
MASKSVKQMSNLKAIGAYTAPRPAVSADASAVSALCPYDAWKSGHWREAPVKPLTLTYNVETYTFYLQRPAFDVPMGPFDDIVNCRTCIERVHQLTRLIGKDGQPVFLGGAKETYPPQLHAAWDAVHAKLRDPTDLVIVPVTQAAYMSETSGHSATGLPYSHFNVWANASARPMPEKIQTLIGNVMRKYYPIVLEMMIKHGQPGITESVRLFKELMESTNADGTPKVPYADKLRFSIKWFQKHIREDFARQSAFKQALHVINAIFSSRIEENKWTPSDPVITVYHQANGNMLSALECAHDEAALIALMKARFSPANYMRPTAAPKGGNVDAAREILGEFRVDAMTSDQADTFGATSFSSGVEESKSSGSMSAFAGMKPKKAGSGAASFASRAHKAKTPTTLKELLEMPGVKLEVCVTGQSPAMAHTLPGLEGKVIHPHGWCFMNNSSPSRVNLSGWEKVSKILPMGAYGPRHRNYLFVCKDSRLPTMVPNCCFPSFLEASIARHCRKAFEALNTSMTVGTPAADNYAIGVGISIGNEDGAFVGKGIRVRVNGREVEISRWS